MPYDPERHHRRSIRWQGYDYAQAGAYFVTICVEHRRCLFGKIVGDEAVLNDAGRMIALWWQRIPERFPGVALDVGVVMPNHLHGIVVIQPVALAQLVQAVADEGGHIGPPLRSAPRGETVASVRPTSLPDVVGWFKTMTTNDYIGGVKQYGWPPFPGRLWQRTYYDRVIRDDGELDRIQYCINENPANWALDPDNPAEART